MSNVTCIESFSDIVAVWPFMEGGISYAFPFNVRKKTVTLSELGKDTVENLTAGKTCLSTGQTYGDTVSVSLEDGESSVRSTTKTGIAGRYHEVVLSLVISDNSEESVAMAEELEGHSHDFVIQTSGGEYLLLRGGGQYYKCSVEEEYSESYKLKVTLTLSCYNGIQRIVKGE